jgi:recombination protein RecT
MTNITDLRKGKKKSDMKTLMAMPPKARIKTLLQENRHEIAAALPTHLSIDRMLTIAQTAATSLPQLLDCYTPSLFGALIKSTQLGLEPNNPLGHAYLVPFKNRKQNRTDVQLIIGYRGMIELARRSGHIKSIQAQAVREGDVFEFEWGTEEKLKHVPGKNRGEITHFYAYAQLTDGGVQFDVQTKEDIDALMRSTQSRGEYGPWKDSYEQMGRKSLIRRLFSNLPCSIQMAQAQVVDAQAERGDDQHLGEILTGEYSVMENEDAPLNVSTARVADDVIVDSNGEMFDEELHASSDGEPIYNKDGSFRKKPGRKPAPEEPTADDSDESDEGEEEEPTGMDNDDDWDLE